jgi:TPR repeat protein
METDATRPGTAPEIFVSFSSKDAPLADRIVEAIRRDFGDKVFYSKDSMRPSVGDWDEFIAEKMNLAYVILGLESPNACESREVKAEWNRGFRGNKLMLVSIVRLEGERLPRWDLLQIEDLCGWLADPTDGAMQKLVRALKDLVNEHKARRQEQRGVDKIPNLEGKQIAPPPMGTPTPEQEPKRIALPVVAASNFSTTELKALPSELPADETPGGGGSADIVLGLTLQDWSVMSSEPMLTKAQRSASMVDIRLAARAGSADAQTLLGLAHFTGLAGQSRDSGAAGRWLQRAAEQGQARAKAELALFFASAPGQTDVARIDALNQEAISAGNVRAKTLRAIMRLAGVQFADLKTSEATTLLLRDAHRLGDILGSAYYGWRLLHGQGVRRNLADAYTIIRDTAQAGEPRAMTHFGIVHAFGRGVPRDAAKAAHWFRLAALRGEPWGQFYYGWSHEIGFGVGRNAAEARIWYRRAADQNDVEAQVRLGLMLIEGRGGLPDFSAAARLLEAASLAGDATAMALLGELYEEGRGVDRNIQEALELYESASEDDEPLALFRLGALYESGRGVPRSTDKAVKFFRRAADNAPTFVFYQKAATKLAYHGVKLRSLST